MLDRPDELRRLVAFIARRVAGEEEAEALTEEVVAWIDRRLGRDYPWPGNFRELEQCVRNVMIRQSYHPPRVRAPGPRQALADAVSGGTVSAAELLRRYCTVVYAQTGSYQETARRLQLDRRTVKSRIDPQLLERLHANDG